MHSVMAIKTTVVYIITTNMYNLSSDVSSSKKHEEVIRKGATSHPDSFDSWVTLSEKIDSATAALNSSNNVTDVVV